MLLRKLLCIGAAGSDLANVVGLHLGQRQLNQQRPGRRDIITARIARQIRIEPPLMRDHEHAVTGDADIELERIDAHRQRGGKGLQRVFRKQSTAAAMGLDVERHGRACEQKKRCRERTKPHDVSLSYRSTPVPISLVSPTLLN